MRVIYGELRGEPALIGWGLYRFILLRKVDFCFKHLAERMTLKKRRKIQHACRIVYILSSCNRRQSRASVAALLPLPLRHVIIRSRHICQLFNDVYIFHLHVFDPIAFSTALHIRPMLDIDLLTIDQVLFTSLGISKRANRNQLICDCCKYLIYFLLVFCRCWYCGGGEMILQFLKL